MNNSNLILNKNTNENSFMCLFHGSRTIVLEEDIRYKLKKDNFYYITYTEFGFSISFNNGNLLQYVITNTNKEINDLIKSYTNYQIKIKSLKIKLKTMSKTKKKKIKLLKTNDKYYLTHKLLIIFFRYYIKIFEGKLIELFKNKYFKNENKNNIFVEILEKFIKIKIKENDYKENDYKENAILNIFNFIFSFKFNVILYNTIEYILKTPEYIEIKINNNKFKITKFITDLFKYIYDKIEIILLKKITTEENDKIDSLCKINEYVKYKLLFPQITYYSNMKEYLKYNKTNEFSFSTNNKIIFNNLNLLRIIMYHSSCNMKIYNKNQRNNKQSIPYIYIGINDYLFYNNKYYKEYIEFIDKFNINLITNNNKNKNNLINSSHININENIKDINENINFDINFDINVDINSDINCNEKNKFKNLTLTNFRNEKYNTNIFKTKYNKINICSKLGLFSLNDKYINEPYKINMDNMDNMNIADNHVNIYLLCFIFFIFCNKYIYINSNEKDKEWFNEKFNKFKLQLYPNYLDNINIYNMIYKINNELYDMYKDDFNIKNVIEKIEYNIKETKNPIYIHIMCCLPHENDKKYKAQQLNTAIETNSENNHYDKNNHSNINNHYDKSKKKKKIYSNIKLIQKKINELLQTLDKKRILINKFKEKDKFDINKKEKKIYEKNIITIEILCININILEEIQLIGIYYTNPEMFFNSINLLIEKYKLNIETITILQILKKNIKLYLINKKIKKTILEFCDSSILKLNNNNNNNNSFFENEKIKNINVKNDLIQNKIYIINKQKNNLIEELKTYNNINTLSIKDKNKYDKIIYNIELINLIYDILSILEKIDIVSFNNIKSQLNDDFILLIHSNKQKLDINTIIKNIKTYTKIFVINKHIIKNITSICNNYIKSYNSHNSHTTKIAQIIQKTKNSINSIKLQNLETSENNFSNINSYQSDIIKRDKPIYKLKKKSKKPIFKKRKSKKLKLYK